MTSRSLLELHDYRVGHWELTKDFKDSSGNDNHGTPNDITWIPTSRGMKPEFNGSSSYIGAVMEQTYMTDDFTFNV